MGKMKKFEIWTEGYAATGEHQPASKMGEAEGETFRDAVLKFMENYSPRKRRDDFNAERLTYWGCRLFDNEADARKSNG